MFACVVLVDATDVIAVLQPTGAPLARRVGARGGPQGRSMEPGGWDGSAREIGSWEGPPSIRVHPVGRSYSVIRWWDEASARHRGWYVNLEQPWIRTAIGFDSRDDVLDVVVAGDLSSCVLKDDDELGYAVEIGTFSASQAENIRAAAEAAVDDVNQRRWPFDESAWSRFRPPLDVTSPALPNGWDEA